jgi:ParB-like chromosome segregation protein Spo0J
MEIEEILIGDLIGDPNNARRHSRSNIEAIKASLEAFGQQKPIVVTNDNVVIAGNGFLMAAMELGWKTIEIVRTSLTKKTAAAFAIADNRTAELADWDLEALQRVIDEMPMPLRMASGWNESEIADILKKAASAEHYKPIITPDFGSSLVTAKDVQRANNVFDVARSESLKVGICCPRCGGEFEIDAPNQ